MVVKTLQNIAIKLNPLKVFNGLCLQVKIVLGLGIINIIALLLMSIENDNHHIFVRYSKEADPMRRTKIYPVFDISFFKNPFTGFATRKIYQSADKHIGDIKKSSLILPIIVVPSMIYTMNLICKGGGKIWGWILTLIFLLYTLYFVYHHATIYSFQTKLKKKYDRLYTYTDYREGGYQKTRYTHWKNTLKVPNS